MKLSNAPNQERGLTLIETTATLVIAGILLAIMAPSFWGLYNRRKIDSALNKVEGALKQSQAEAIKRGQACTVTLNVTDNKVTGSCIAESNLSGINLKTSQGTNVNITFSFKGTTTNMTTVALYDSGASNSYKRCLAISLGTGMMRTGFYEGAVPPVNADNCQTTE